MKTILLFILLQVAYPTYEFKSTSTYPVSTQETGICQDNNSNKPGPRKVSGIDGWYWWILWGSSHGVPSNATNQEMLDYYDYIQSGGTLSFNDWLYGQSVPVGEIPAIFFVTIAIYIQIKLKKVERKPEKGQK